MKTIICLLLTAVIMVSAQQDEVEHHETDHERPQIPEPEGTHIGQLRGAEHSISGSLYALDESVLLLKQFEYDGEAEDAFFWVGTSGEKPSTTGTILPYPFGGVYYNSEDKNAPFLYGVFNGSKEIRLTLPEELKVTDLRWFSVWTRAGKRSLGEVIFPTGFVLDKKFSSSSSSSVNSGPILTNFASNTNSNPTYSTETNTDLPPPLLSGNAHDPRRVDKWADHHDQGDAQAEPEGEPEVNDDHDNEHHRQQQEQEHFGIGQPRRSGASGLISSLSLLSVSIIFAKCL